MLKWTSKSSMHNSSESTARSSLDSPIHELEGIHSKCQDRRGLSDDELEYLAGHCSDDVLSEDFAMFNDTERSMGDALDAKNDLLTYPEPDLHWSPLSKKQECATCKKPSSLSLPSSPVEHKGKSKNLNSSSKSGIFKRFKNMFTKSSKERKSKSLPSSPKHVRNHVGIMNEKPVKEKAESYKKPQSRLERLIESKRNRRKTLCLGKHPWDESADSNYQWKETMKTKISLPEYESSHNRYGEDDIDDSNYVAQSQHNSHLDQKIQDDLESSTGFRQSADEYLPHASSFRDELTNDFEKPKQADDCTKIQTSAVVRNKRYSDTFIVIKNSQNETPKKWLNQYHNAEDSIHEDEDNYHTSNVCSKDAMEAQRIAYSRHGQLRPMAIDPVIIQTTRKALRPCNERFSPRYGNGKFQSSRSTVTNRQYCPIALKTEPRQKVLKSPHTTNNNNGQHLIQKPDFDEMTIGNLENDSLNSLSVINGGEIPSPTYRQNIRQVQLNAAFLSKQSSVRDIVRDLEEKMFQNQPELSNSPCKSKCLKAQTDQMPKYVSSLESGNSPCSHIVKRKSLVDDVEAEISKHELHQQNKEFLRSDQTNELNRETNTIRAVDITTTLVDGSMEKCASFLASEGGNTNLHYETAQESVWEDGGITFHSQLKTSEFDVNFSTAQNMETCKLECENSDVSSHSTFSKMANDAREYCDSSSASFTSSLNVKLAQNEKLLSNKSSLSSCIESISANSLHSNVTFPIDQAENESDHDLLRVLGGLSNFESKSTEESTNSTSCTRDIRGNKRDLIDQEIMACVNLTTSNYVNIMDSPKNDKDNHLRQRGNTEWDGDIETKEEKFIDTDYNEGIMVDSSEDAQRITCHENDLESKCFSIYSDDMTSVAQVTDCAVQEHTFLSLENMHNDKDKSCDVHDIGSQNVFFEPETVNKIQQSDQQLIEKTMMKPNHNDETSLQSEKSSISELNQGLIIFTMPDFSINEDKQCTQEAITETSSVSHKRVSFKLEAGTLSSTSNESSDEAQVEGNVSDQSCVPEEDKETEKCIDGSMPLIPEHTSLEPSASLERNTSPSSVGLSDISWVLDPYSSGLLCNEIKDLPTVEQLPKDSIPETPLNTDMMESYPSQVIEDCQVYDIEEPSLVVNSYVDETSIPIDLAQKQDVRQKEEDIIINIVTTKVDTKMTDYIDMKEEMCENKPEQKIITPEMTGIEDNESCLKEDVSPVVYSIEDPDNQLIDNKKKTSIVFEISEKPVEMTKKNNVGVMTENIQTIDNNGTIGETATSAVNDDDVLSDESYDLPLPKDNFSGHVALKKNGDPCEMEQFGFEYGSPEKSPPFGNSRNQIINNTIHDVSCDEEDAPFNQQHDHSRVFDQYEEDENITEGTLFSWPYNETIYSNDADERPGYMRYKDSYEELEPLDKQYAVQNGYTKQAEESTVESSQTETPNNRKQLSTKRKDKISRGLQVSGVEMKDVAIYTSDLCIDNSGDCNDSEEELHSSVNDSIARMLNDKSQRGQKKNHNNLHRNHDKAQRVSVSRKKRKGCDERRHKRWVDRDKWEGRSCHRDISSRQSQSDHNMFNIPYQFMKNAAIRGNNHRDDVASNKDEKINSILPEPAAKNQSLHQENQVENESRKSDVHWMTAFLNYQPGQWLFLATFLFFQLLFHCIYVK